MHAALLNSDLSTSMHADILRDFAANGGLLYLAPEQLRREDVRTALVAAHVRRVVVDEAHILPQVEHGFRKDYRRIGPFIESLPEHPQVLAFTATATRSDLSYIAERLCMRDPKRLLFPVARKNIKLYIKKITVQGKTGKTRKLQNARLRLLDDVLRKYRKNGATIIYCPCVKDVKRTTKWLRSRNYPVKAYHGKMRRRKRAHVQDYFLTKRARSSWPRTPSVWALTVPTCGWSCTPDCPSVSMRTRRKSAAPDATEKRRAPYCSTRHRTNIW